MRKTVNVDKDTVYVMNCTELAEILKKMKLGYQIWYQDYNPSRPDEDTLHKRIMRLMIEGQDVYLFGLSTNVGCAVDVCIVTHEAIEQATKSNPFEEQVGDAISIVNEWTHPTGFVAVFECELVNDTTIK